MKTFPRCAVALALFLIPLVVQAQSDRDPERPWSYSEQKGRWFYEVGLELESEPAYTGSSDSEIEPFPLFQLTYRTQGGTQYFFGLGELGVKIPATQRLWIVASAGLEDGRDVDDSPALEGLDPIDEGIDFALATYFRKGPWLVAAQVQTDVGNDKGTVAFLGGGYEIDSASDRWRFGVGFDLSWGDGAHMRREFGVTAAEAERTSYETFQPDAGIKTATLGLELDRFLQNRWVVGFEVEIERYLGSATDSPLIATVGRDTTLEAGLFVRRSFGGSR